MTTTICYPIGRVSITVECQSVTEGIRELSKYSEFFGETQCGACQSDHVVPSHRQAKSYDFYEMHCLACGAKLSFGQTKEGGKLFPKRKDQNGRVVGKNGWHQYQAAQQESGWV